jgi:hypothetical protein
MQKSGGIIALIGGIFGTIAALITLFAGGMMAGLEGMSAALNDSAADHSGSIAVAVFGILGLFASFATIIFGAICMAARSRVPGVFLIIFSIVGMISGGTFVAVCMILTFVGGLLAVIGFKATQEPVPEK